MATISNAGNSKPQTHSGDLAALPAALAPLSAMPQWVNFRWIQNGGKWTKPPFQPQNPSRVARNNACETWSSYADAVKAVKAGEADGLGFVLTGTNVAAIDLDRCRDAITGEIDDWADPEGRWAGGCRPSRSG